MHSLIHHPSDVLHHGTLDTFSCFLNGKMLSFLKYSTHGPSNLAQKLHRRICGSVATECLLPCTTMDDCGSPMLRFRGSQNPFTFRRMLLYCTAPMNAVIVRHGPIYVINTINDKISFQFFHNPTDLFTYLMHCTHLCVPCWWFRGRRCHCSLH